MTASPPQGCLEVGRIGRAHGVRGAVVVTLTSDRHERVRPARSAARRAAVAGGRIVRDRSRSTDGWCSSRASPTATQPSAWPAGRCAPSPIADDDAMWVHDLIGSSVVDAAGVVRGTCVSVLDNPAHDILELDTGHLVPIIFVTVVGRRRDHRRSARRPVRPARLTRCRHSPSLPGRWTTSQRPTCDGVLRPGNGSSTWTTASTFKGPYRWGNGSGASPSCSYDQRRGQQRLVDVQQHQVGDAAVEALEHAGHLIGAC